jgi:hypothetical protein
MSTKNIPQESDWNDIKSKDQFDANSYLNNIKYSDS